MPLSAQHIAMQVKALCFPARRLLLLAIPGTLAIPRTLAIPLAIPGTLAILGHWPFLRLSEGGSVATFLATASLEAVCQHGHLRFLAVSCFAFRALSLWIFGRGGPELRSAIGPWEAVCVVAPTIFKAVRSAQYHTTLCARVHATRAGDRPPRAGKARS